MKKRFCGQKRAENKIWICDFYLNSDSKTNQILSNFLSIFIKPLLFDSTNRSIYIGNNCQAKNKNHQKNICNRKCRTIHCGLVWLSFFHIQPFNLQSNYSRMLDDCLPICCVQYLDIICKFNTEIKIWIVEIKIDDE